MFSACHQIPERSIKFRGKPLVCYRCFGVYLSFGLLFIYQISGILMGFLLGSSLSLYQNITGNNLLLEFILVVSLHLPMIIDGGWQAYSKNYQSKNIIRFVTGILAGVGQYSMFMLFGSIFHLIFS